MTKHMKKRSILLEMFKKRVEKNYKKLPRALLSWIVYVTSLKQGKFNILNREKSVLRTRWGTFYH
jgi:hypothetical protein